MIEEGNPINSQRKVFLVDDHKIFLQGLRIIVESFDQYRIIGEASDIQGTLDFLKEHKVDILILDLNLGEEDGLLLLKKIQEQYSDIKILVLSMLNEQVYAQRVIQAGAKGYIMKEETAEVLQTALDSISNGRVWLSRRMQHALLESISKSENQRNGNPLTTSVDRLSNRQLQVLNLLGKGYGSVEIASKLNLSTKTVEAHKFQLRKK